MAQYMSLMEITQFLVKRYDEALMRLTKWERTGLRKVELDEIKHEIERLSTLPTLEVPGIEEEFVETMEGEVEIGDEEIKDDKSGTGNRRKRTKSSRSDVDSTPV